MSWVIVLSALGRVDEPTTNPHNCKVRLPVGISAHSAEEVFNHVCEYAHSGEHEWMRTVRLIGPGNYHATRVRCLGVSPVQSSPLT